MNHDQALQFSIFSLGAASLVLMLAASYAQSTYSIPGFNLKPGESFTVKINITDSEEFALGKVRDLGGQLDISNVYLQHIKHEGFINVTDFDARIKFIGNASLGQAWFRFDNVKLNDTGEYSVLYKRENSADLFTVTFQVNVTKEAREGIPDKAASNQVFCQASMLSFDILVSAVIAVALILIN